MYNLIIGSVFTCILFSGWTICAQEEEGKELAVSNLASKCRYFAHLSVPIEKEVQPALAMKFAVMHFEEDEHVALDSSDVPVILLKLASIKKIEPIFMLKISPNKRLIYMAVYYAPPKDANSRGQIWIDRLIQRAESHALQNNVSVRDADMLECDDFEKKLAKLEKNIREKLGANVAKLPEVLPGITP
jgi:hypothetical protein